MTVAGCVSSPAPLFYLPEPTTFSSFNNILSSHLQDSELPIIAGQGATPLRQAAISSPSIKKPSKQLPLPKRLNGRVLKGSNGIAYYGKLTIYVHIRHVELMLAFARICFWMVVRLVTVKVFPSLPSIMGLRPNRPS